MTQRYLNVANLADTGIIMFDRRRVLIALILTCGYFSLVVFALISMLPN